MFIYFSKQKPKKIIRVFILLSRIFNIEQNVFFPHVHMCLSHTRARQVHAM